METNRNLLAAVSLIAVLSPNLGVAAGSTDPSADTEAPSRNLIQEIPGHKRSPEESAILDRMRSQLEEMAEGGRPDREATDGAEGARAAQPRSVDVPDPGDLPDPQDTSEERPSVSERAAIQKALSALPGDILEKDATDIDRAMVLRVVCGDGDSMIGTPERREQFQEARAVLCSSD
ncbi:hypothetical protein [Salipiger mucosus]|uniref:hypothetical protein n=1 Tax=Salipiger mucosus TaxID=263378 RepID=UPI00036C031F|nr:hypothetical protein [Salipiger mucosus]